MSHICPDHCRQFRGSLCVWYSKTNIWRMPITRTDAPHVDFSTAKSGPGPVPKLLRNSPPPANANARAWADPADAVSCPERESTKRGESRGNSSQGPDVHYGDETHFVAGDTGISKWTVSGTIPMGKKIRANGCNFYTFRSGLVVKKEFSTRRLSSTEIELLGTLASPPHSKKAVKKKAKKKSAKQGLSKAGRLRETAHARSARFVNQSCIWENDLKVLRRSDRSMACTSRYSTLGRLACPGGKPVRVLGRTSADRSPDPGCPDVLGVRLEAGRKPYGPREPGYVSNRTPFVHLSHAFGRRFNPASINWRMAPIG